MEEFVLRVLVRWFGLPAALILVGAGFAAVVVLVVGFCGFVFVCFGGCLGFAILDGATSRAEQVTVVGHHWARSVQVLEAHDAQFGVEWDVRRLEKLDGDDLAPVWPVVRDDRCAWAGCQKPGTRSEVYLLRVRLRDGATKTCAVPEGTWPKFAVGSRVDATVGGISGAVTCRDATPQAAPEPAPEPPPDRGRPRRGRGRR